MWVGLGTHVCECVEQRPVSAVSLKRSRYSFCREVSYRAQSLPIQTDWLISELWECPCFFLLRTRTIRLPCSIPRAQSSWQATVWCSQSHANTKKTKKDDTTMSNVIFQHRGSCWWHSGRNLLLQSCEGGKTTFIHWINQYWLFHENWDTFMNKMD